MERLGECFGKYWSVWVCFRAFGRVLERLGALGRLSERFWIVLGRLGLVEFWSIWRVLEHFRALWSRWERLGECGSL